MRQNNEKVFETEKDLINEKKTIEKFCEVRKCEYMKMPKWDLDFLIHKDGYGIAFAEVKVRNQSYSSFPTQMLALNKLNGLLRSNEYLPSYIIYKYTDGIYYIHVKDIESNEIKYSGWNKERKGSKHDKEWLTYFDRALMKKL
jgi:hypothetical protein